MGKVLQFPISQEYQVFEARSRLILTHLIDVLSQFQLSGSLSLKSFIALLDTYNVDPYRDFTTADFAILKFHCENYYNLGSYFNDEND